MDRLEHGMIPPCHHRPGVNKLRQVPQGSMEPPFVISIKNGTMQR